MPVTDETLSSWLFRCSCNRRVLNIERIGLYEQPVHWWRGLVLETEDPDNDFISGCCRLGVGRPYMEPKILERFFALQSGSVVKWGHRRLFCPDCLRSDVASGRLPIWRRSWCYDSSAECAEHGRALTVLHELPRYSRAWDAFVQICNFSSSDITPPRSKFARLRSACIARVAHSLKYASLGQGCLQQNLFNKFFNIFLQAPFRGSFGGAARVYFQRRNGLRLAEPVSLEESILIGPSSADVHSRYGSLMFAASLLGILPVPRFIMFVRRCEAESFGWSLPENLHLAAALPSVDRAGYEFLRDYLGRFSRMEFPLLDHYLRFQEQRYYREGVHSGHSFGE